MYETKNKYALHIMGLQKIKVKKKTKRIQKPNQLVCIKTELNDTKTSTIKEINETVGVMRLCLRWEHAHNAMPVYMWREKTFMCGIIATFLKRNEALL